MTFGIILKCIVNKSLEDREKKYIKITPNMPIVENKKRIKKEFGLDPEDKIAISVSFPNGESYHLSDDATLKQVILKNKNISHISVYLPGFTEK